ncbi:trypsin delta-like [Copidosoma floridanum]|uniref:trypsin delta-like n=1 Tax=Copidosoma floridanum TaxID=29053 RepID=UPI0006C9A52A|nr:trypsin delta-like [Copidosoma floridanum]
MTTSRSSYAILVLLVLVTYILVTRGNPRLGKKPLGRVLGSENAVIRDYPYMVSIEKLGHFAGSGAILNSRYVLTTASRAHSAQTLELSIRAGTSLRGQGGFVHQVDKIVLHEKYNLTDGATARPTSFDVAVVRVAEPFNFDEECQPARLFNQSEGAPSGVEARLTGWGDPGTGELSLQMQVARLAVLERGSCGSELSDGQFCAGGPGRQLCRGDEGGPLALGSRLVGMAAWGFGCAGSTLPAVFTEIAHYRDWIDEHAKF